MGLLSKQSPSVPSTFDRLRDEVDRTLQHWWSGNGEFDELLSGVDWQPRVDIAETDESVEVKVDLPGIKPEDVEISVSDNQLTIQGERKDEKETKNKKVHRVERSYGSFYRTIPLPAGAKPEDVAAESDNGVITITLPKSPELKGKRIEVKPR